MESITITMQTIMILCGVVAALGGAAAVIAKWFTPFRQLKQKVERHAELLDRDKRHLERIEVSMVEDRQTSRIQCKATIALLEHAITGNSVEKLREAKEALQQHLIDH